MNRDEVLIALAAAIDAAVGWHRRSTPAAPDVAITRELELANDVLIRLREIATDLETAP